MPGVHSAQLTVALCDDGFMFAMSGMTFMICPPAQVPVPPWSCQHGPTLFVAVHGIRMLSDTAPVLLREWLTTEQSGSLVPGFLAMVPWMQGGWIVMPISSAMRISAGANESAQID